MAVVPLGAMWGGTGEPLWSTGGLESGLQGFDVRDGEDLLPELAVGLEEEVAVVVGGLLPSKGEGRVEGVWEADMVPEQEDRLSRRF